MQNQTNPNVVEAAPHMEGKTTKAIERKVSAIPSLAFLIAAGGAVTGSLVLKLLGKDTAANFVGQWVPSILLLGLYNKIVKVVGSEHGPDRWEHQNQNATAPS